MIASGYTLDLYCDAENEEHVYSEFPHEYISDERQCKQICFSNARKDGWKIGKQEQLCPKCSGKNKRATQ